MDDGPAEVDDAPQVRPQALPATRPQGHLQRRGNVAWIHLTGFNVGTDDTLHRAIDRARSEIGSELAGIILDMRSNRGGLLDQAIARIEGLYGPDRKAMPSVLLVESEGWHVGVIGIVASRLRERYNRPACVVALDGAIGKGSGRSVGGVALGPAVIAARIAKAGLRMRLGEDVIAKTVCRHAVKANDPLSGRELDQLITDLRKCAMPYTCPHGRPTLIEMSLKELEKKFGRVQ